MKEQTTHTTPNIIRDNNGVKVRSRDVLVRLIKEHREEFEVFGFDGVLRVRCKCGKELYYKTYEDIPLNSVDCSECGYEGVLKYLGYTIPCPHCNYKMKFYEYPDIKKNVYLCEACQKDINYDKLGNVKIVKKVKK